MKKISTLLLILLFFNLAHSQDTFVVTAALSGQPNGWEKNGKFVGAGIELIRLILNDFKIPLQTDSMPFARSLSLMKTGEVDAIATIFYAKEREEFLTYTEPYTTLDSSVFVKKGKAFKFERWEDLINLKGASIIGEIQGQKFEEFAKSNLNITKVPTLEQLIHMLEAERIDYAVYVKDGFLIETKKLGASDKIEVLPNPISSQKVHIAISNKSKYISYLPKINKKIIQYRNDGTLNKLIKKAIIEASQEKI